MSHDHGGVMQREYVYLKSILNFTSQKSHSQAGSAIFRPIYHPLMQNHSLAGPVPMSGLRAQKSFEMVINQLMCVEGQLKAHKWSRPASDVALAGSE